jgi:hypothetical protein
VLSFSAYHPVGRFQGRRRWFTFAQSSMLIEESSLSRLETVIAPSLCYLGDAWLIF